MTMVSRIGLVIRICQLGMFREEAKHAEKKINVSLRQLCLFRRHLFFLLILFSFAPNGIDLPPGTTSLQLTRYYFVLMVMWKRSKQWKKRGERSRRAVSFYLCFSSFGRDKF